MASSGKISTSTSTGKRSGDTFRGGYAAGKIPSGGLKPPPKSIVTTKKSPSK